MGGDSNAAAFLSRWKHEITVAVLRNRAAMARAVQHRLAPRAAWLLTGERQGDATSDVRAPQLDEDAESEDNYEV